MSADNLVRIQKKENGLYKVTHESASSLVHAMAGVEPTQEELLLNVVADDVSKKVAQKKAEEFCKEYEDEGYPVEYGIVDENWRK